MATRLRDTVVLVTGASSGIGSATARPLAAEGAAMALVARRRDRLEQVAETITDAGRSALILDADLTDADQAAEGLTRAVDELGRLDVVVNNAGLLYVGTIADA